MDEHLKQCALDLFRKHLKDHRKILRGTYLAVNLRTVVKDWLARPRIGFPDVTTLEPHEQIELITFICDGVRRSWLEKAHRTRIRNRAKKRVAADKAKQLNLL